MTLLGETRAGSRLRWTAAVAIVAAVHAGAVAWATYKPADDDFDSQTGGAFVVELSQVTTSPDEAPDIAIGQKSDQVAAVAASTPQVSSVAKPAPDEQPLVPEAKEPPPDDTLAKTEDRPPDEQKPREEAAAQAKDAPYVAPVEASEAAAPQPIENAKTSETARAQNTGLSRQDRLALQNWQKDFVVHINRFKRYPSKARDTRDEGTVMVSFAMDRAGKIIRAAVSKGSGSVVLDQAAVDLLNRASPLPAPPASIAGEMIEYNVPIEYALK